MMVRTAACHGGASEVIKSRIKDLRFRAVRYNRFPGPPRAFARLREPFREPFIKGTRRPSRTRRERIAGIGRRAAQRGPGGPRDLPLRYRCPRWYTGRKVPAGSRGRDGTGFVGAIVAPRSAGRADRDATGTGTGVRAGTLVVAGGLGGPLWGVAGGRGGNGALRLRGVPASVAGRARWQRGGREGGRRPVMAGQGAPARPLLSRARTARSRRWRQRGPAWRPAGCPQDGATPQVSSSAEVGRRWRGGHVEVSEISAKASSNAEVGRRRSGGRAESTGLPSGTQTGRRRGGDRTRGRAAGVAGVGGRPGAS
jgi:hypothetical protein